MIPDQAFTIRHNGEQVWQIALNGKVLPHTWNSKGAASRKTTFNKTGEPQCQNANP